jgi:oligopeptide/dipeptide ABC transporter ATP-binding protein
MRVEPVLQGQDVWVRFATHDGEVEAVKGVSFHVNAGECLGVVGESGSGKSQTFLAAMGLLAQNGKTSGSIRFKGQELLGLSMRKLNDIRGAKMSMIFQDPLTSLTPHLTVGQQLREVLDIHTQIRGSEADKRVLDWVQRVRIPEAKRRLAQYPHELSGGMRQRVMIAMSMLCEPELLIADEPTTALDVTVQAQILDLMDELKRDTGTAIVLITHDMGVVARMCDRVQVMKTGAYLEGGTADAVFYNPQSDYTKMLLAAIPRLDRTDRGGRPTLEPVAKDAEVLVEATDIKVHFPIKVGGGILPKTVPLRAVDGVSFHIKKGETLGVVGESGCGKSTLSRAVLRLLPATTGVVSILGRNLTALDKRQLRAARKDLQIVFQDPLASLDPRMTIGSSIAEPLLVYRPGMGRADREAAVKAMMEKAGLDPNLINRYPHELSGGQNQRVGIARAMILQPNLVICDEAVSALDVSIRAQIIDLLIALQKEFGLSMMFISHDLAVVREISHRIMVLYLGRIVELADRDSIYTDARHPYTKALLSAAPIPDPKVERARVRVKLEGEPPSPMDPAGALRFLPSKRNADPKAPIYVPQLLTVAPGHVVAEFDPV